MLVMALISMPALAQDFDLSWHSIDGGAGESTGGDFELSGTIGQPDVSAEPLSGGAFELLGGFWPVAVPVEQCTQVGDLNLDGLLDGDDVQLFVDCLVNNAGSNCACADLDGGGLGPSDVGAFVGALLSS